MRALIAIVGPTGVGKSALATRLARTYDGEVVNADSRQIYRYMDIGTAKPDATHRIEVPHHLFDIISPDQPYSLAVYQRAVLDAVRDTQVRGNLPLLVGGSGQYIWSVIEGWQIPSVAPVPELRGALTEEAARSGPDALHRRLASIDPEAASKIMPGNVRRVIRAMEIHQVTGKRPSELRRKKALPYPYLVLGLTAARSRLYALIDERVDEMVRRGLVEEVRRLIEMGYSSNLPSMSSLGYREIAGYLQGGTSLAEAISRMKFETHRFARSQMTWFRRDDPRICWFDVDGDNEIKIDYTIRTFLRTCEKR